MHSQHHAMVARASGSLPASWSARECMHALDPGLRVEVLAVAFKLTPLRLPCCSQVDSAPSLKRCELTSPSLPPSLPPSLGVWGS